MLFRSQSGALGIDILARVQRRGLGVSSFVSAGNRADVSGNDLLQFWEEDDDTDVIMLYLESMGNVGKFLRLARRIGRNKPIVTLRTTGAMSVHPLGHDVPVSHLQEKAREQLFAASGIIDAGSLDEMLDIAEVLRLRGLPEGNRLGLVGNDSAVATLARNAAEESGLRVEAEPWLTGRVSTADRYRRLLDEAARDPSVDAILAFYVPPVESAEDVRIREVLATVAASIEKPTVAVVVGVSASAMRSEAADGARTGAGLRSLPVFTDVEHATRALGTLAAYAAWRDAEPGTFGDLHPLPTDMLEDWPDTEGQEMSGAQALAALGKLGLPVAAASDGSAAQASCVLIATVDPLVGPVLMFGLDDEVTSLLDEYAFAVAPLTQQDAHRMLDGLKTLPLLRERAGSAGLDALAAFLARVGDIVVESPGPVRIECRPLLVGEKGPVITTASIRGLSDELGPTWQARRLGR